MPLDYNVVRVRSLTAKMLRIKVTALLLSLVMNFHVTTGECPQMNDIPVMCPDGEYYCPKDTFTCMKYWSDLGDDLSVNACNGEYYIHLCSPVVINGVKIFLDAKHLYQ